MNTRLKISSWTSLMSALFATFMDFLFLRQQTIPIYTFTFDDADSLQVTLSGLASLIVSNRRFRHNDYPLSLPDR